MRLRGALLSVGSQRNRHPEGCVGDLKLLIWLFDIYQWFSGVHPLDVLGYILLTGGRKYSYSTLQLQGRVLWGLWCWTFPRQVSTEERHPAKKIAVATIWIIISFEIFLKGMDARVYRTVQYQVHVTSWIKFMEISRSAIYHNSGPNSLLSCTRGILK